MMLLFAECMTLLAACGAVMYFALLAAFGAFLICRGTLSVFRGAVGSLVASHQEKKAIVAELDGLLPAAPPPDEYHLILAEFDESLEYHRILAQLDEEFRADAELRQAPALPCICGATPGEGCLK